MAAHADRIEIIPLAGPACEHVAAIIDRYGAAQGLAGAAETVSHRRSSSRQRQPMDPALLVGADLRRLHQAVPQPLRVDDEIGDRCGLHGTTSILRSTGRGAESSFMSRWRHALPGTAPRDEIAVASLGPQVPSFHAILPREMVIHGTPVHL